MQLRRLAISFGIVLAVGGAAFTVSRQIRSPQPLVTGKFISPSGKQTEVGSFPLNMVTSPDGRYFVVTNVGFRQQLSVIDARSGQLVSRVDSNKLGETPREGLYYGLAFGKGPSGETRLYASRGAQDEVTIYDFSAAGELRPVGTIRNPGPPNPGKVPHHIAGLALNSDGKTLYAVNNQTHAYNDFRGSVSILDVQTGKETRKIPVGGYPYAVTAITQGPNADRRIYVTNERDSRVSAIDLESGAVTDIPVGSQPTGLLLDRQQRRLFVTNSSGDTLSIIDTARNVVTDTVLLRPGDFHGVPGAVPLGMALSPDERKMFVAIAEMNAVAVVDLPSKRLEGMVDVGWHPTSVSVSADGGRLFVANAKGTKLRNPNDKPVGELGQYGANIIEGTISTIDLPAAMRNLAASTTRVRNNNMAAMGTPERIAKGFTKPPIEHVIYIIKENRTYDQVLGDLPKGNGDKSLNLFPREVTPNQHALAERFVLLDNFYVCAEMSADGWPWSTQGMVNAHTSRNVVYNYSKRGRNYDFEGQNNGTAVDLKGIPDVATAPNGYIWDQAERDQVTFRNYGFYTSFGPPEKDPEGKPLSIDNEPTKRALVGRTNEDFRRYDMAFADSDAWVRHGLPPAPRQLATYGRFNDPARTTTWLRDFRAYVKNGDMPQFMMVRLGRDHTSGTTAGQYSPRACVADNDYAVGQIVEAVSRSPYWSKTAICILEDDAQAGFDHVDSHRSIAFVISPYIQKGKIDSRFYNTVSMLRTMGLLLGLKPHNQYIAGATPINVFSGQAVNPEPYAAILPSKEIIGEINRPTAYRAADSARLIDRFEEESLPDIELNDILWGAIKGAKTPRPALRGARWSAEIDD